MSGKLFISTSGNGVSSVSHDPLQSFVPRPIRCRSFAHVFLNLMGRQREIDSRLHNTPGLFRGLNPTGLCRGTCSSLKMHPRCPAHVYRIISYLAIVLFQYQRRLFLFFATSEENRHEQREMDSSDEFHVRMAIALSPGSLLPFSFPWLFIIGQTFRVAWRNFCRQFCAIMVARRQAEKRISISRVRAKAPNKRRREISAACADRGREKDSKFHPRFIASSFLSRAFAFTL